ITAPQMGWMAAVIDIKGKVYTKSNKDRATPQFVLAVSSKDARIIARLGNLTGTQPEMRAMKDAPEFMRHPCVKHCPDAHQHIRPWQMPDTGLWTITGLGMAILLWNLKPYMATYYQFSEQVNTVLQNTKPNGKGSGAVRASIRRLAELGWKIPPGIMDEYRKGTLAIEAA